MREDQSDALKPMAEQITYANILFIGAWAGIFLMIITYIVYVSGILPPHVDISLITSNWDKGVSEYLDITHSPQGWGWVALLSRGDFLNYLGLAFIALLTIVCYLVLTVAYARRSDRVYFIISVLEIAVLSLAASGIFGAGGH